MNLLSKRTLSTLLSGSILFSGMLSYNAYASGEISQTVLTKALLSDEVKNVL